jgi:serine phosphatase RsbU (regulator of sigma subunit)
LYSDGIIDQPNPARDRFGTNKFINILNENLHEPLHKIQACLEKAFDEHKASEEQRDDITILGLKLN